MQGMPVGGRAYGVRIRDAVHRPGCYSIVYMSNTTAVNEPNTFQFIPLDDANHPCSNSDRSFRLWLNLVEETALKCDRDVLAC